VCFACVCLLFALSSAVRARVRKSGLDQECVKDRASACSFASWCVRVCDKEGQIENVCERGRVRVLLQVGVCACALDYA